MMQKIFVITVLISISLKELSKASDWLRFRGDNGQGISDLELLFEPFHTTKKPGDGVGLGLAISSDIIKSHGGDINFCKSNLGGLKVMISLPV